MRRSRSDTRAPRLAAAVLALAALVVAASNGLATEQEELERTWDKAWVYAPDRSETGYRTMTTADLGAYAPAGPSRPAAVVLYAHGCDGLGRISVASASFLARAGHLVVAPDGFARQDKPVSCDPPRHLGGLHREVLGWRHAEMRHAAEMLARLPGLDGVPVVLMGHSEGGITTATVKDIAVSGRIVEGWTCHAGWPEYHGLNAAADQPVLALVGDNDPWFRLPVLTGDCGAFMKPGSASRSVVYRSPDPLSGKHWLSSDSGVQQLILAFIQDIVDNK